MPRYIHNGRLIKQHFSNLGIVLNVAVSTSPATYALMVVNITLLCRHNGCDGVSNQKPHHCLLKRLFRRRSKKISKLRVTGLSVGNSPVTGEFPAQMASNAENDSIWWRHHDRYRCIDALTLSWPGNNHSEVIDQGHRKHFKIVVKWTLCELLWKRRYWHFTLFLTHMAFCTYTEWLLHNRRL